ncbi:hypothetical protein ROZALSC1DRAFT_28564 [Rozella allomycis CSF55]|uniref:PIN domain-containing protein n=1 Tax=Rozella allomycis (strain CSF55) TaxID=988480 RepID=A0A075B0L1_ROZAC|nr:hypothetical protein O9G_005385 [Rozella allomycis CSF55]RKP19889.1 hypothetical protein ROZALSC1DRAFT_28564 [Rozella allomycis CSF55]|eukprot:EPZ35926.1 hypothetical protein O9G_005385 [Rozella allomycis CSF55]
MELEKLQKLYLVVQKYEKKLADDFSFSRIRKEYNEACVNIIMSNMAIARKYDIENRMWKYGIYAAIDTFRRNVKNCSEDKRTSILELINWGIETYLKILKQFNDNVVNLPAIETIHLLFIRIGDLARYKSIYFDDKLIEEAIEMYKKATELLPSSGKGYHQLGICYLQKNDLFQSCYYFIRSYLVKHSYPGASEQIFLIQSRCIPGSPLSIICSFFSYIKYKNFYRLLSIDKIDASNVKFDDLDILQFSCCLIGCVKHQGKLKTEPKFLILFNSVLEYLSIICYEKCSELLKGPQKDELEILLTHLYKYLIPFFLIFMFAAKYDILDEFSQSLIETLNTILLLAESFPVDDKGLRCDTFFKSISTLDASNWNINDILLQNAKNLSRPFLDPSEMDDISDVFILFTRLMKLSKSLNVFDKEKNEFKVKMEEKESLNENCFVMDDSDESVEMKNDVMAFLSSDEESQNEEISKLIQKKNKLQNLVDTEKPSIDLHEVDLVLDTNVLFYDLKWLQKLIDKKIQVFIPVAVWIELAGFKNHPRQKYIQEAIDYIEKNDKIRIIGPTANIIDRKLLNFTLDISSTFDQLKKAHGNAAMDSGKVILISNDQNLALKSTATKIECITLRELKKLIQ